MNKSQYLINILDVNNDGRLCEILNKIGKSVDFDFTSCIFVKIFTNLKSFSMSEELLCYAALTINIKVI